MSRFLEYLLRAQKDRVPYYGLYGRLRRKGVAKDRAEELAEEGANVAYIRAIEEENKKPDSFESEDIFRGWVTTTGYRSILDVFRQESRTRDPLPDDLAASNRPIELEETVLGKCLSLLSEIEQTIVREKKENGLDAREIIPILKAKWPDALNTKGTANKPPGPRDHTGDVIEVSRLYNKAKRQLEDCLKNEGESPYRRAR